MQKLFETKYTILTLHFLFLRNYVYSKTIYHIRSTYGFK